MIITRTVARKLAQSADNALQGVGGAFRAFLEAEADETEALIAEAAQRREVLEYALGQGLGMLRRFLDGAGEEGHDDVFGFEGTDEPCRGTSPRRRQSKK